MHLSLEDVSVSFPIFGPSTRRLLSRDSLQSVLGGILDRGKRKNVAVLHALQDINLHLVPGDRLALVGPNGAGKSTLLRVLAGVLVPTTGRVSSEGKVVPFLSGSLGMEMDATGNENIDIGCLYLGMSRVETEEMRESIASFTELGAFIDMPVRTYSAGMMSRLAFAIATAARPDILVVDEGIGAGDAAFQEKASARLRNFMEQTRILVVASHSDELLRQFCNKAAWIEKGMIRMTGSVDEVIDAYHGKTG